MFTNEFHIQNKIIDQLIIALNNQHNKKFIFLQTNWFAAFFVLNYCRHQYDYHLKKVKGKIATVP